MKPIIKINKLRFVFKNIVGITLFPFIFVKDTYYNSLTEEKKKTLLNHETIHFHQQKELFIIGFYLWYLIEWLIKLFKYKGESYNNISFEREAYKNENNLEYLKTRKLYGFLKYL